MALSLTTSLTKSLTQSLTGSSEGTPFWVLGSGPMGAGPATIDLNFVTDTYFNETVTNRGAAITVTRASAGTNLLPTSASGYAYTTFGSGVSRVTPGVGLQVEEARTNVLLHSAAPVTQTTGSLPAGTYTLWVNGSGSATSSAGTAVGSGFGAATNGSPNIFVLSSPGTVVVTVAGSLNAFQCELGTFGTSFITTVGSTVARAADIVMINSVPVFGVGYTLYASGTPLAPAAYGTNQFFLSASDGSTNNMVDLFRAGGTGFGGLSITIAGVVKGGPSGSSILAQNGLSKAAASLTNGAQHLATNGTLWTATTATPMPTSALTELGIDRGDFTGGRTFDGTIARVAVWPSTIVGTTQLTALTTGSGP